ncbi:MAG: hypothetical protein O3C40_29245 [Planctomycetota bacterium]|nr:hypothetical protein [Planctomycetota bacterium]
MNEATAIATWDVLLELGFVPVADPMPGLVFDFGNLTLRATSLINLQFAEVVAFSGVLATPQTVAEIDFEMPRRIASRERCAAWIIWYMDQAAKGGVFHPGREVGWVAEGRQHEHLLPWVIEQARREQRKAQYEARYHARAYCIIARNWARLALNTLAGYLDKVSDETPVVFFFKDSVLTIRCNLEVIALAGSGDDWEKRYAIEAGQLRQLPKRLVDRHVEVKILDERLFIGYQFYSGIRDALS